MELTIDRLKLLEALDRVSCAIDKKSPMPILADVQLVCTGDRLELNATDLVLSARAVVPLSAPASRGSLCVSHELLVATLKRRSDASVRLSAEKLSLTVDAAGSRRKTSGIGCVPGEDFPNVAIEPLGGEAHAAAPLLGAIADVQHAMSSDTTRVHLCAVCAHLGGGRVVTVATDGHRLALSSAILETAGAPQRLLLPAVLVKALRSRPIVRFGTQKTPDGKTWIVGEGEGFVVRAQPVDSAFPSYDQVIPKDHTRELRVARGAFSDAIAAAAEVQGDRTAGVRLELRAGSVLVRSDNPERCQFEDAVDADVTAPEAEGKSFVIGVNAKYLTEALSSMGTELVHVEMTGALDPLCVRDPKRTERLNMIMPMRV